MSGLWEVRDEPSTGYRAWVSESDSLFSSLPWSNVLRTLAAQPLFAWNANEHWGALVPVFKRTGLKIGFFGFPQLNAWPFAGDSLAMQRAARAIAAEAGLDLVRTNLGFCDRWDPRASAARPELWINDLSSWDTEGSKRRRRDLSHARRAGCRIERECIDSLECHRMYARTVRSHGGQPRYGENYFAALSALARADTRICFHSGLGEGGQLLGFAVLAMDGDVALYLHGAANEEGKRRGISDLLLDSVVESAAASGCKRLTMMASPWKQTGLLSFKRKWSDTEGLVQTFDCGHGALGASAAFLASVAFRRERYAARRWQKTR